MSIHEQALPELLDRWADLEDALAAQGIAIAIDDFGGFRTAADTAEIIGYKQADYAAYAARERAAGRTPQPITGAWENGGSRPIAPYGRSWHDYGAARDVRIVSKPADMTGLAAVAAVDDAAESVGLETGARYGDPLHVQLPISLEDARAAWESISGGSSSSSSSTAALVVIAALIGVVYVARHARGLPSWV